MVSTPTTSKSQSFWSRETRIKGLLGLGFWVQGFRCNFPWMAVNFYLKDRLNVDPSTLQILQNSANLPMVGKPFYGVLSDAVYIFGQHRLPYIAIGAFFQALSWLSQSSISVFGITMYLLLSNLAASITEVANDAIVAEVEKGTKSSASSELQSFVWIASSLGGLLGNLLGGVAIKRFSLQAMFLLFGLIVSLQFSVTICVHERSFGLPKSSFNTGIKKQLLELQVALKKPEITYSIMWLAASYAVIPALTGTMFFYQTQHLKIDSSVLGLSKVFGQVAAILWSVIYNTHLKSVSSRKLITAIQATMAMFMVSDALFVKGFYRNTGVPDSFYVIVFSGLLDVLYFTKMLPFNVLMAQLCPPGCEGSIMALVASATSLALIISGYLGVALTTHIGVSGDNFSGFPYALLIQAGCTLLPVYWSSSLADDKKPKSKKET